MARSRKQIKEIKYDGLIDEAIELCKENKIITPSIIQDKFHIGFIRSCVIFNQLVKLGILTEFELDEKQMEIYDSRLVGVVDKEKIRELMWN